MSLRACTRINGNTVSCVRLRAGYRTGLIKSQNAFARKKSQTSNALWVQKLSGCTTHASSLVHALYDLLFLKVHSSLRRASKLVHVLYILLFTSHNGNLVGSAGSR